MRDCSLLARRALTGALVALSALLTAGPASGQVSGFDVEAAARPAATAEGRSARLDVLTAVPHTSLQFLARGSGFEASYAGTVEVYAADRGGGLVVSRTFDRDVEAPSYAATQDAEAEDYAVQTVDVAPGEYRVVVSIEDGASGRVLSHETAHTVRDMARGAVALADPLLLRAYDPASGERTPIVGATVSTELDAVWVATEVHADRAADLRVTYLVTETSRLRERPSFGALLGLAPRQRAESGTPVAVTEPLAVGAGATPAAFRIETEALQVGDYTLTVRLSTPDGETVAQADRPLQVRWTGLDGQIADLDQAIAQLRYVADEDEWQAIRNAPTPQEQRRRFLAFWQGRDPSPGTARNEQMESYYFRVARANDQFSRFRNRGWNTDRGEVFIRFGEPDRIEEHGSGYGTQPYQIWLYYGEGRRFTFIDDTGMGDFRLLIGIWDDRTRM